METSTTEIRSLNAAPY